MLKDGDYNPKLDDLFGGSDASEQHDEPTASDTGKKYNYPPPPMPMPMPMSMPMPMPTVPASEPVPVSLPPTSTSDDKLGQYIQQDPANLSLLFQQFLEQQAAGVPPASSSLYNNSQVAWPTQLEPKANPPPAGLKISHSRDKNGDNRIGQYDWYDTFPVRENWVARHGDKQIPIKYTKQGELKMPISMDRHSVEAYIRGCAERGIPLRLWVQNVPTMHADRYPNIRYHRCRAHDCPEKGTLGRGAYQVCFDEHPTETTNGRFDPFYVAGYMHLFCLEEMVSLAHLMTFADVQPDVRDFPLEERNPMSLQRDGVRVLEDVYRAWKYTHVDAPVSTGTPISKAPRRRDSDCLYYNLTKKKLESQPTTRQKMRDRRKGNDISKYHGNLRKRAEFNAAAKKKRKMARFSSDCSSGADLGDASLAMPPPPTPRSSSAKRQRFSSVYTQQQQQQQQQQPATASLQTAVTQPHGCTASPLRRSRRQSGAAAGSAKQSIQLTASPSSLLTSYNNPYGNFTSDAGTFDLGMDTTTSTTTAALGGRRQSLNVRTDQVSLALGNIDYSTANIDGLVYDFSNAYASFQDPANASAHYLHFGQVSTPNGTYGVDTAPVPYDLRPTQARRDTAIRQTSARISLTEGIRCDEKRLIEAVNVNVQNVNVNSPRGSGLQKTPTTALFRRASQAAARSSSSARIDATATIAASSRTDATTTTPSSSSPAAARRVTRSMSRHVSATEGPSSQGFALDPALMYPQELDDFPEGFFDFAAFT